MNNENIDEKKNLPQQKSHWQKYKFYYLIFGSFFVALLIILISNIKKEKSEQKNNHSYISDKFTIPDLRKQNKNWVDESISNQKIRDEVKIWINSFKYLPPYQTKEGLEVDKHSLLYGPTGSGKSFLAQKFAENESAAFFKAQFETETFVGSSIRKQREVFDEAKILEKQEQIKAINENRKSRPVVIIMDELDSFGVKDKFGHNNHTLQEVNGILRMFDDVHNKNLNIIFIGITNYRYLLDEALIRSGRLGRQIKIDYPEEEEINKLINYLEKVVKNGYKYSANEDKWEIGKNSKEMIIEWPSNFWSEISQHSKDIKKKYTNDKIGFSLRELQSCVSECLAIKAGENVQKIIPNNDDYQKRLEKIMVDKKAFQQEKIASQRIWLGVPDIIES